MSSRPSITHSNGVAEALVKQYRLSDIEKSFRSGGSLLDTRQPVEFGNVDNMFTRTEVYKKKKGNLKIQSNSLDETGIDSSRGEASVDNEDWEVEDSIYMSKVHDPTYRHMRKFQNPELYAYYASFDAGKKRLFRQLSLEIVHGIAKRFREEMVNVQDQLNGTGVFHQDANAHRVHSLYITKLFKSIRVDAVDYPVLYRLKAEDLHKSVGEIDIDDKYKRAHELAASSKIFRSTWDGRRADRRAALHAPTIKAEEGLKGGQDGSKAKEEPRVGRKVEKSIKKHTTVKDRAKSPPKSTTRAEAPSPSHFVEVQTHPSKNKNQTASPPSVLAATPGASDKFAFVRALNGKAGFMDPRAVLVEEAERLAAAEIVDIRKPRDKNAFYDDQISEWMTSTLLGSQIERSSSSAIIPPEAAAEEEEQQSRVGALPGVRKVIPYEDFVGMFNAHLAMTSSASPNGDDAAPGVTVAAAAVSPPLLQGRSAVQQLISTDKIFERFAKQIMNAAAPTETKASTRVREGDDIGSVKIRKSRKATLIGEISKTDEGDFFTDKTRTNSSKKAYGFRNVFLSPSVTKGKADMVLSLASSLSEASLQQINIDNASESEVTDAVTGLTPVKDCAHVRKDGSSPAPTHKRVVGFSVSPHDVSRDKDSTASSAVGALTSRTSSTGTSPKRRSTRLIRQRSVAGLMGTSVAEPVVDVHDKLGECLDALQVPRVDRLELMIKYSGSTHCDMFVSFVDIWSEAAVLVLARQQLLKLCSKKNRGFCVLPFDLSTLCESVKHCFRGYPTLLSRCAEVVPIQRLGTTPTATHPIPLSASSVDSVFSILDQATVIYSACSGDDDETDRGRGMIAQDDQSLQRFLEYVGRSLDKLLKCSIDRSYAELADSVIFGHSPCSEWIEQTKEW